MKKIKVTLAAVMLCIAAHSSNASWFGSDTKHLERERELQRQNQQEQVRTKNWQTATFLLGIGCIVILVVGTAIGSKAKRAAKEGILHEPGTSA